MRLPATLPDDAPHLLVVDDDRRIRDLLSRFLAGEGYRVSTAANPPVESVSFGPFVYHLARGELRHGEEIIRLTDREREMLRVLAATPGETVARLALAGNGGTVSERAVDVQVNRLRRKIERNPANPMFVQTVRGIGYRLVITT